MIRKNSVADAILLMARLVEKCRDFIRDISDFQFDRTIGKGGFGEVWLAHDLRTGKLCAVKELQAECLNVVSVASFIREVQCMIELRNQRFILPFVGFTVEAPYSIITEYVPNGSLLNYTYFRIQKAKLSGTHLTIGAMCIAHGMTKLNEKNIVHRDLKCANILIDNNYLPMICDFGTSRLINPTKRMSPRVGTITHMAPEVIQESNYDFSCDVYSYGMILFEMSQGHHPFGGTKEQITEKVLGGQFPKFWVKNTPSCLVNLMKRCWERDITKRPTFLEIYNEFKTGATFFRETETETVTKFAEQIEKLGERNLPLPPVNPSIDVKAIIQRMTRQYKKLKAEENKNLTAEDKDPRNQIRIMSKPRGKRSPRNRQRSNRPPNNKDNQSNNTPKEGTGKDEVVSPSAKDILKNTDHPQFIPTLNAYSEQLDISHFKAFYFIVAKHFQADITNLNMAAIIDSFLAMAKRDNKFFEEFEAVHLYATLPQNPEKIVIESIFNLIWLLFSERPELVGHSLFRILGMLIMTEPEKSLALCSLYATKFENVEDPFSIFDFLSKYARAFVDNDYGTTYIDIFNYLMTNFVETRQIRIENYVVILSAMCKSHNKNVALTATKAFVNLLDLVKSQPNVMTTSYSFDRSISIENIANIDTPKDTSSSNNIHNNNANSSAERSMNSIENLSIFDIIKIPFTTIIKNMLDKKLARPSISLLRRIDHFPASRTLLKVLIKNLPASSGVILKFISENENNAMIAAERTSWMQGMTTISIRIFMSIFIWPEARKIMLKNKSIVAQYLSTLPTSKSKEVLYATGSLVKRIPLDQEFIDLLTETGFFKNYATCVISSNDLQLIQTCNSLIDSVARIGFTPDYVKYIPLLMKLLSARNDATKGAISVLSTLSNHKQLIPIFKKPEIIGYFQALQKTKFKNQADAFLKNVTE
ncbi:hypothetical protein TRFO_02960 [Tritrichomonas foetus]|uniref:Protein kinase domain-containing protein n=1 Tax=Tritrichomonas foetus TaxID=1144522 RepID=A0A1J4KV04_9EUKA|nr:hypothetical protein TRFO_02960 [Tritrichomonas foetus]|eukprot:OHT14712.1 hypothetical protein TRFO_02960 [Tritrichomonas foetus]